MLVLPTVMGSCSILDLANLVQEVFVHPGCWCQVQGKLLVL